MIKYDIIIRGPSGLASNPAKLIASILRTWSVECHVEDEEWYDQGPEHDESFGKLIETMKDSSVEIKVEHLPWGG